MSWTPCSGRETFDDLVWLPRMLQKARQHEESCVAGRDLMNGYLFGDSDFIDHRILRFLRTDDTALLTLVREHPADEDVARIVLQRSGRTTEERRRFSRRLRRMLADFVVLEADEGRLPPGPTSSVIRFVYNRLMMPTAYLMFRNAERKRIAG